MTEPFLGKEEKAYEDLLDTNNTFSELKKLQPHRSTPQAVYNVIMSTKLIAFLKQKADVKSNSY